MASLLFMLARIAVRLTVLSHLQTSALLHCTHTPRVQHLRVCTVQQMKFLSCYRVYHEVLSSFQLTCNIKLFLKIRVR